MKSTVFSGKVQAGKLVLDNLQGFQRMVRLLDGKAVDVSVKKHVRKRSLPQNAWYWGVLIPTLGDHLGMDGNELHDALKVHFLSEEHPSGLVRVKSTASLTTAQYSKWMEDCQRLAAEHGVDVPMPDEMAIPEQGEQWQHEASTK